MTDTNTPASVVEAIAERFKYEHRNACYPDATDFEAREAAEQFLALAAQPSDDVREAFKAGWRTNAVGEDVQPASYLDGCEQADWEEYQRVGIDAYCTAVSQTDKQPDNELADAADVHMVREAPLTAQERLRCEEVIANLAALCNPPDNEQADAADSEPSGEANQ